MATGIVKEILPEMMKLLGLGEKIQVTYRSYSSISNMAEDLHKGELDVIFPVFSCM